jgi:head-tail adaptor
MLTPSGEFDRQVTIQRNVPTRDASMGGEVPNWQTVTTCWARYRETPNEPSPALGVQQNLSAAFRGGKVRIRYIDGLDMTMRISDAGQLWEITGMAVLGRKDEIDFAVRDWAHK